MPITRLPSSNFSRRRSFPPMPLPPIYIAKRYTPSLQQCFRLVNLQSPHGLSLIKPNVAIKLTRQDGMAVMRLSLRIGTINHADESTQTLLHQLLSQLLIILSLSEIQKEAFDTRLTNQKLIAVWKTRKNFHNLQVSVPLIRSCNSSSVSTAFRASWPRLSSLRCRPMELALALPRWLLRTQTTSFAPLPLWSRIRWRVSNL
jgi:hypothetical protein